MPELPEVEAARLLVEKHCLGKTIVKATAADDESADLPGRIKLSMFMGK